MTKTEKFIKKAVWKHGDIYAYDKVEYVNAKTKVEIYCKKHEEYFTQAPSNHLTGAGCPKCGMERSNAHKQKNTETFVKESTEKHKGFYDYSKVKYTQSSAKVTIICPKHGEFNQIATDHINGNGCPKCGYERTNKAQTHTSEKFIEKSKKIHGDRYDYTQVEYVNAKTPVTLKCEIHGNFQIKPYHHTQGSGCQECGKDRSEKFKFSNKEEFIEKAERIHKGLYKYEQVEYKTAMTKVKILCKKHGIFEQTPNGHLSGSGCSKCSATTSKSEKEVLAFIRKHTKAEEGNRKILGGNEIDIYVPSKKVGIEYNGLYWHSDKYKKDHYHLGKTRECQNQRITLIHVFDDEWRLKKDIVKSRLLNIIGKTENIIYARKTSIKEVPTTEAMTFLEENHLQGKVGGNVKLGLYYNNELVSLMTFGGLRANLGGKAEEGKYELLRFCNKLNTTVVGGASKLLKNFLKEYQPKEIISYADRRWSEGNLYEKLGFEKVSTTKPNYFYTKGQVRENRFKYRKSELVKEGFDKNKTERQIMEDRGYNRIYDCGTIKFKLVTI